MMDQSTDISVQTYGSYKHLKGETDNIKVCFADSNRMIAQTESVYKKHTHVVYEAIIIEKGVYRCSVNDTQLLLNEWDMIVIQPGQKHEDFLQKGTAWYTFHFWINAEDDQTSLIFERNTPPQDQILHIEGESREFFASMIKLFESEAKINAEECYHIHSSMFRAVFHKILSLYRKDLLSEQFITQNAMRQEATKIQTVFHRNLARQPSLQELCKQTAMSRSSLYRACELYFNRSPRKAFLQYKMNHIYEFIKENPEISVKELSQIFGFKTQFHFSRLFTQEMGCYPSLVINNGK
ncbi:MAG: AraC family transcriptional regulator [Lentisphaerae bacterium]|nr:AraC family transcriptional regulator [Lentisphaerota bacterium]